MDSQRSLRPQISIEITPPEETVSEVAMVRRRSTVKRPAPSPPGPPADVVMRERKTPLRHQPLSLNLGGSSEDIEVRGSDLYKRHTFDVIDSDTNSQDSNHMLKAEHKWRNGLFSSVRNLLQISKSTSKLNVDSNAKPPHHRRQFSDSLLLDVQCYNLSDMDTPPPSTIQRKVIKRSHKKCMLVIDHILGEALVHLTCFNPIGRHHSVEFEVQRMDLSEINLGVLKHAESNDHISQMDEQSTLSRIEKLFPNDDLDLIASKRHRRRRSAPSQILLKSFKKSPSDRLSSSGDYVSRKFIFESPVSFSTGLQTQDRYLFLFNDVLFVAKQRSATSYKLKHRVSVCDMWISDNLTDVTENEHIDPASSFVIGWPTTNYVASFKTPELCARWRDKLTSQIRDEHVKEVEHISITVIYKNQISHQTQKLVVHQQTDVKTLLRRALDVFHVKTERDSDYQIWLVPNKDDEIYPLIGHERPFAIQLNHERIREADDSDMNLKFVLRESKKQLKLDRKSQKSKKSKRLALSGLFRRSSGKLPQSPSEPTGKIFQHNLSDICTPGLPQPLMELLDRLYNVGPFTTEIFRKPANSRKCSELVDRMDSENSDGWSDNCNNGILLASVLKTFLKKLPDNLCCCHLYDEWCSALNHESTNDKIIQFRRVMDQMPEANLLVLKHIICILYHIQLRHHENKMTSSNLSVCIGPSLLWTADLNPALQEVSSRNVPLIVQFLIDNVDSVFQPSIVDLFGHEPVAPADSDDEQTGIQTGYNDSLESLSDNDHRRALGLTQMSPSSCSRDSGLILSDPLEDGAEHSDDLSLRPNIIKSKSCDSLTTTSRAALQTQVSSDSLDCDDEYVELRGFDAILTKSRSGSHLSYPKPANTETNSNSRLRERLSSLASRYSEHSPPLPQTTGNYSSTDDSDKSDMDNPGSKPAWGLEIHKSSTGSSLHHGSSSSDDQLSYDRVTHRHIVEPKFSESENGFSAKDLLRQFTRKQKQEEAERKQIQQIVQKKLSDDSGKLTHSQSSTEIKNAQLTLPNHRSPKISRNNTFTGQGSLDRRSNNSANVSLQGNMAEMRPIMPQQYRTIPRQPPPYREAVERKELIQSGITEIERIKQTVNSARAKQLYQKSLQIFESQERTTPIPAVSSPRRKSSTSDESITSFYSQHIRQQSNNNNEETIGVLKTTDKRIVIKKAPVQHTDSSNMFYSPNSPDEAPRRSPQISHSTGNLASSFYRPYQPPPYKEAMKRKVSNVELIESLGSESLV